VKGSVRQIAFYPRRIRGKRYRPLRLGHVVRGLLVQLKAPRRFLDNTRCSFRKNSVVLLKKRGVFKAQTFYGPCVRLAQKRRYVTLFESFV
jgi:ribosomal protein L14